MPLLLLLRRQGAAPRRACCTAATVVDATATPPLALLHGTQEHVRVQLSKAQLREDATAGAESYIIGDRLTLGTRPSSGSGRAWDISARKPRTRTLRRFLDARNRRAVVANATQLVVMTAVQPPPNRGLIDRLLVAAESEEIAALLVLNKIDIGTEALGSAREIMSSYTSAGYRMLEVSVNTGAGLATLRQHLAARAGQLSILVGHSGVGKSSLLNAVVPGAQLPTDELSRSRRGFR